MKVSEIATQVNADIDEEYDNAQIMSWINRCLDQLASVARKEAKTEFAINSSNEYPLPENFHDYAYVRVNGEIYNPVSMRDDQSIGYSDWGGNLSIQNGASTGTIQLFYYRKLQHVSKADDVPEIEPEYHDLFVLYGIGRIQFTEEEYDRPDSMTEYKERLKEYEKYKQGRKKINRVRLVDVYG